MREDGDTQENPAAGVGARVPWQVVDVKPVGTFRLLLRFVDGTHGDVDLSRLMARANAGVLERLRDPTFFARVGVENGAVTWPGEIDLAPDAMYDGIRAHGIWIPG